MPHLNLFESDAFSLMSLTAAINEAPHKPGLLGALGLFEEEGISTTHFDVEVEKSTFMLVPAQPRGAPGQPKGGNARSLIAFRTTHLPQRSTILADSVQNVRAFGSENELEGIETVRNQRLAKMRGDLDRKSTRLNSSHVKISYAVFCLKKKIKYHIGGCHLTLECNGNCIALAYRCYAKHLEQRNCHVDIQTSIDVDCDLSLNSLRQSWR